MLIITSVMNNGNPDDLLNQQTAVKSWIEAGFRVLSVNTEEEIAASGGFFSDVEFVEPQRTGMEQYGKPIPYIYDMLKILEQESGQEDEVCGIVNSDIILRGLTASGLQSLLEEQEECILCLHRYDIDTCDDMDGTYYFSGIDAFFMRRKSIRIFETSDCALSKPEWDHWIVYSAIKNNLKVKEIKNALAFHVRHRQRWTPMESNAIGSTGKGDSFGEEYYDVTNQVLENLDNQILLGGDLNPGELVSVEDAAEIYADRDLYRLAQIEMDRHDTDAVTFSVGVGYYKGNQFCRICASHGRLRGENGYLVCKPGADREKTVHLGEIAAYLDFPRIMSKEQLGRFYIYPAGRAGRLMLECCQSYDRRPLGFVDKDQRLQGTEYRGAAVYGPEVLLKTEDYDKILIVSNLYMEEIYEELKNIVPEEKLLVI